MKVISAILCLALLSHTLAYSSMRKIPPTVIDTSFLKTQEQKKATFAQLTTVMQQLRDVSEVTEFLNGLLQEVADLRAANLAIIEQTRANCQEEEAFREEAVQAGERGATASQRQLALCTQQQNQASSLNALAANALAQDQQELQNTNDNREAQRRTFAENQQKLQQLLDNIVALNQFLDSYEAEGTGSVSNAQFIEATNKLLKHTISTGHSHLILPIYTNLLQMHARQTVDEDSLAEVRQLLSEISYQASTEQQKNADDDAQAEADYEAKVDFLQTLINRLSTQVGVTEQFSTTMDQCIAVETSVSALSEDKASRNQELLEASQELCAQAEEKWRVSELAR